MPNSDGLRGRPSREHRQVVEGIAFRYRTEVAWRDLPERFGARRVVDEGARRRRRQGSPAGHFADAGAGRRRSDAAAAAGAVEGSPARSDDPAPHHARSWPTRPTPPGRSAPTYARAALSASSPNRTTRRHTASAAARAADDPSAATPRPTPAATSSSAPSTRSSTGRTGHPLRQTRSHLPRRPRPGRRTHLGRPPSKHVLVPSPASRGRMRRYELSLFRRHIGRWAPRTGTDHRDPRKADEP